ncbi:hypothetical protein [Cognatitamlana onchidii]|uniref:hypothetical protein n=1 Tax=Cognatitamlana onchidii TaxID=2562860 RepID=UPI0010A67206|nr:hypothetical protein [Algibacter onchidii]
MKRIGMALMAVLLSTSLMMASNKDELVKQRTTINKLNGSSYVNFDGDNPKKGKTLRVRDIEVYELEEEVKLGFDTKEYLPADFNPVEGLDLEKQLDFETSMMFEEIFGEIPTIEVLKIEDIELFEVEEEL